MNGLRSSKGSTDYLYSGTTLIKESNSTHTIYVSYYYVRNLLGDVTGVIDTSGNLVVQYAYDSWGKILSTTGSMANTVGTLNLIRYRGYYYDVETGLYYLQSRYYDPETGRFISPDVIAEGGNIYTYCLNDPVNRSDESGYLSFFITARWKRWGEKITKGIDKAVDWIEESIGWAFVVENTEGFSCDVGVGRADVGASSKATLMTGDFKKPITFYAQVTEDITQLSDYQLGASVNVGDGGIEVAAGFNWLSGAYLWAK